MATRPSKEYASFAKLTDRLLSVPRVELQKRLDEYRDKAAANPRKRGPKRKVSPDLPLPAARKHER